jgi:non-canonical poly(A) RNA polymerase PAPD5/7
MPALRPLVLVMKCFLKQRKLHSAASSGLSSYALICMAISYLQVRCRLLRSRGLANNILCLWKLNPAQRSSESIDDPLKTGSLGTTLMDFLLYYGTNFPYEDSYISVTQGKLLPKESADWINHNKRHKLVVQCLVNPGEFTDKSGSCPGSDSYLTTAFCP